MQQDAVAKCRELSIVQWMARGCQIHRGYLAFRRCERMHERAIIGEEQKAGCVLIQTSHALHAALRQLRRQQVKDAQVVLRIA